jgi:hypothetical protein
MDFSEVSSEGGKVDTAGSGSYPVGHFFITGAELRDSSGTVSVI